ncbi:MAG: hypothetical protein ACXV8R_02280 [Acidimicrobiia bacterium]
MALTREIAREWRDWEIRNGYRDHPDDVATKDKVEALEERVTLLESRFVIAAEWLTEALDRIDDLERSQS